MEHIITISFGNATMIVERGNGETRMTRVTTKNVHGEIIDVVETPNEYLFCDHPLDISDMLQEFKET